MQQLYSNVMMGRSFKVYMAVLALTVVGVPTFLAVGLAIMLLVGV